MYKKEIKDNYSDFYCALHKLQENGEKPINSFLRKY